ncbi:hypothetical protein QTP88_004769 [Uroleucon formosanum]
MSTVYCVGISYNMCIGALKCHLPSPTTRRRWSINPRECGAYYILSYMYATKAQLRQCRTIPVAVD